MLAGAAHIAGHAGALRAQPTAEAAAAAEPAGRCGDRCHQLWARSKARPAEACQLATHQLPCFLLVVLACISAAHEVSPGFVL